MAGKGLQTFTIQESQNIVLGQLGSVFLDTATAIAPPANHAFVAITFLADTTLHATGGLVAEDSSLYPNTAAAAHNFGAGSATTLEGEGGGLVDASNTFPKGVTIYGRWTSVIKNDTGRAIFYFGK